MMHFEEELSAAPEQENLYDDYELFVAVSSYDGRSLCVWKRDANGEEERIQLKAPSRHMGKRISFVEDDLIQITEQSTNFGGWWKGSLNGAVGIFPSCLLEALDTSPLTLDSLEDTMASMDTLLASMSGSLPTVQTEDLDMTPRSREKQIESLAQRLEEVADNTPAPAIDAVEECIRRVEEHEDTAEAVQQPPAALEQQPPPTTETTEEGPASGTGKSAAKRGRVMRPASIRISREDGTTVTKTIAAAQAPASVKKVAPAALPAGVRAIRTIKITKTAKASAKPSMPAPTRPASAAPAARPAGPARATVVAGRGSRRSITVIRPKVGSRSAVTEVIVADDSDAPPAGRQPVLSPRRTAAAPLSPHKPVPMEVDMPLAPPPEAAMQSRAARCDDAPLAPPPADEPLPPPDDLQADVQLEREGTERPQVASEEEAEEEELSGLDDLPDVERTLRLPDEPAPPPPEAEQRVKEEEEAVGSAGDTSSTSSNLSLDLTTVAERMRGTKEVVAPITPGTRARLHSLPRPDEPAPKCPFDYDPYEDSYGEEGNDDTDHHDDSSDEEPPPVARKKPTRSLSEESTASASLTQSGPPVQLRAKTKRRLREKAQKREARGQHHQLNRASSAPSVKEASSTEPAQVIAPASGKQSPAMQSKSVPSRAASSVAKVDTADVSTADVQLRPRVRKALKKRKRQQGQAPPPARDPAVPLREPSSGEKTPAEKRRYIFNEVVATERSYVAAMEQLVQVMAGLLQIQRKLTESGDTGATLPSELQTLHVSATIILGYSKKTLEMMVPRLKSYQDDQTCIGDIFLLVADFLKIYTQYVRGYEPFVNKFLIARQKNRLLREQVEKYEMTVGSFITFESHLIVPVQRIPRYSMLLTDMLKNTDEQHPDYHLLAEAVRKIERVADFVNARQAVYENLNKVIELEKKYGKQLTEQTGISQFVRSHRRVIKEASLQLYSADAKGKRVEVSLLNDLLVVGTTSRQSTLKNWGGCKLLNVVCLWLVTHKNVTDVPNRQHCFELVMEATSETVLVLRCSSEEEKREWMQELAAVKRMLNKAINVGAKTAEQKKRISIALNVKWTSPAIPQEIALALAEEQAQRRQQANMQMMPITRVASEWTRITELPVEITSALRTESNKKSRHRRAPSSDEGEEDTEIEEQEGAERSISPPPRAVSAHAASAGGTNSAERARSPVARRMKKSKSAVKLRKTLSPLSRHKDGGKQGGKLASSTLRGRDRAAAAAAAAEEEEKERPLSPRALKAVAKEGMSTWSPKMLKLRLGKSKEKGMDEKGEGKEGRKKDEKEERKREEKKREEREREEKEERRREDKKEERKRKEDRKKEEKEERREKKREERLRRDKEEAALDAAPALLKSGLASPRSEKTALAKRQGQRKKQFTSGHSVSSSAAKKRRHSRSNSVECQSSPDASAERRRAAIERRRRTRRSVSMSDISPAEEMLPPLAASLSTGACAAPQLQPREKLGRRRSRDTATKKKRRRTTSKEEPRLVPKQSSLRKSG